MIKQVFLSNLKKVNSFLLTGAGAGFILFCAAVFAVLVANSGFADLYNGILATNIGINIGDFVIEDPVSKWINDALMAIFFLMVGLEIKREIMTGELSSFSLAIMPAIAAFGGMVAPGLIFTFFNYHDPILMRGWAIPMATDIAFSLGVLALLGARVPLALKVFLTAVAVIDDLLAILIIAFFYTAELNFDYLIICVAILVVMFLLNIFFNVTRKAPYLILGAILWYFMHKSGVHATLAGVFTAMCIPHGGKQEEKTGTSSTLVSLEHDLHTMVVYFILPLFAFANSGVSFVGLSVASIFSESLSLGIMLGLLLGKPIGICLAMWIAIKLKVGNLPRQTNWFAVLAMSLLCGIGFTVSLFIGNLGFVGKDPELLNLVKAGVLSGSIIAGIIGYLVMNVALKHNK